MSLAQFFRAAVDSGQVRAGPGRSGLTVETGMDTLGGQARVGEGISS
jgi:hypothetical protein